MYPFYRLTGLILISVHLGSWGGVHPWYVAIPVNHGNHNDRQENLCRQKKDMQMNMIFSLFHQACHHTLEHVNLWTTPVCCPQIWHANNYHLHYFWLLSISDDLFLCNLLNSPKVIVNHKPHSQELMTFMFNLICIKNVGLII